MNYLPSNEIGDMHPCFNVNNMDFARIHLPVAPKCNLGCNYCNHNYYNDEEDKPGVCKKIISPMEAVFAVRDALISYPELRVAGIAGPGEPLANDETLQTFSLLDKSYPQLIKCLSTNGILLSEKMDALIGCKVQALTITINSFEAESIEKMYSYVELHGKVYIGREGANLIRKLQMDGLKLAVESDILLKVNIIYIEGINSSGIDEFSKQLKHLGVKRVNLMPLIPRNKFCNIKMNSDNLNMLRNKIMNLFKVKSLCQQCRADALGFVKCKQQLTE